MQDNTAKTCTALLALSMVFVATGAGCLVDNEDAGPDREAEVLEIPYDFDLDESGRPDFRIYGGYRDNLGTSGRGVMRLWIGVPRIGGNEGNALPAERKLVEDDGNMKWEGISMATFEQGFSIGPATIGSWEDPPVASEETFAWSDSGTLCRRFNDGGEKHCSGPFAGRKAYLGLRLGRGDTARYGWALLEVDTMRTDRSGIPLVILHDYAVRSEPGAPLETGAHP